MAAPPIQPSSQPPRQWLVAEPLQARAFAAFGDVIDTAGTEPRTINEGFAERFDDLARLDTLRLGGHPVLSLFRAKPRTLSFQLRLVERHLLGSQAFVPLLQQRFLVVVAPAGPPPVPAQLRCFVTSPGQGVNYAAGTWHHPLIALDTGGDFVVIDRGGPQTAEDCEEHSLLQANAWVRLP